MLTWAITSVGKMLYPLYAEYTAGTARGGRRDPGPAEEESAALRAVRDHGDVLYGAVGELDRAMACHEPAFRVRWAGLICLHVDPGYQPLRSDPRFPHLVDWIGLR